MPDIQTSSHGVILLEEAWQPPIAEKLQSLARLRETLGTQTKLLVLLVGRPQAEDFLTSPKSEEVKLWERQLSTLGDSGLRVEPWRKS